VIGQLRDATIALHDIDAEELSAAGMMDRWIAGHYQAPAVIKKYTYRRACLDGAEVVINMVLIAGSQAIITALDTPAKYGPK
jgi:alpha-galactosidase